MRIPSQLNDETLYGRRRRRPQPAQSYRRLIRLGVALVLVIVVMQQASQPEVYQTFFGEDADVAAESSPVDAVAAPGGALIGDAGQNAKSNSPTIGNPTIGNPREIALDRIPASVLDSARIITGALSQNEQRQWTVVLDRWQSNESFRVIESVITATADVVQQVDGLDDEQRIAWTATLRRFGSQFATVDRVGVQLNVVAGDPTRDDADNETQDETLGDGDHVRLNAWLASLDQAATERVVDGALWRSEDFDAFYRQLDQADRVDAHGAIAVAVVPLMQQPEIYLGRRVRVQGRVARSEKKEAAANPFGVQSYWELWIRPSSGGDRPFVLIVPDAPQSVRAVGISADAKKGPEIRVVGKFFKRLAYGSAYGADAAPVIIGRIVGYPSDGALSAASATVRGSTRADRESQVSRFWIVLGLAVLVGVSVAAVVMWRTAIYAKRARQLRNSHRKSPGEFLQAFDGPDSDQAT
ncbi:MAG: hypothetical protein HKN47_09015 [Pirellulaceae bacterium]|nr:hypothetical protein [Pirellulaceae bacterium]